MDKLFLLSVKLIPLSQGQFAVVDDDDFERLNCYRWFAQKLVRKCRTSYYAGRLIRGEHADTLVLMHRDLLGVVDSKIQVDHKNGNTLDNRKTNLRCATHGQNQQNRHKAPGCSSRFKGVYWNKKLGKWQVQVAGCYLGVFQREEEAAQAYNEEAKRKFKNFARLNA